jgi:hypothetical protein
MRTAIQLLVGGILVGTGVLAAATGGFVVPGGEAAQVISSLGYDGVNDITITQQGMMAVTFFIVGAGLMISANATAWKQTGGY